MYLALILNVGGSTNKKHTILYLLKMISDFLNGCYGKYIEAQDGSIPLLVPCR
jgi:hypothetical protein